MISISGLSALKGVSSLIYLIRIRIFGPRKIILKKFSGHIVKVLIPPLEDAKCCSVDGTPPSTSAHLSQLLL